ncbi:beta-N-acetylglucosaminidase [Clostridium tetanomorphum]|uniref:Hydrolase n=1 Tax=Clostridium tetanomorphum TaxID=1553 RepID=A0A923J1Z3_CLOTT|nr:N-acetylglucosaminidase [Clostridium tetanomorphum]KAJ49967.1 cell wall hydrolase [Clostridium tetanomorphum DSM 665]MBC2399294.1 hydrolase [Clostridium tetanomorphum]MBP1866098.1 beta-N-acetylglucosaminidase [Clostridium tetanomorphum]NRS86726.1 beta-N-acetylglucosaminidase [Clostridium tetanomorphum]NRZ99521.1 beta-N-acetylglucosaminidase [Clostridium tetanomorphum]
MKQLKSIILALTLSTLFITNGVIAASNSYKELEPKSSISVNKKWTIKFNFGVNKETINEENVNVTDLKGNKLDAYIKPGDSESSVVVIPKTEGYIPAQSYYLNIGTGVESLGGKKLVQPVKMKFTVVDRYSDASNYEDGVNITSVKMKYEPIVSSQKQTFYLSSSNNEQAQYRIYISKYKYSNDCYEPFEEITKGYTYANDGKITPDKIFESNEDSQKYKVLIYVKKANANGKYVDGNTDFDNYYIDYIRCVKGISNSEITNVSYYKTLAEVLDKQSKPGVSVTDEGPTSWVGASTNQIKYYLNPKNFTDEYGKYIFLKLNYIDDSINEEDLNNILKGKGTLEGKGKAFLQAGKENNVNPVYLVSHALHETANGKSKLASGIEVDGKDGKKIVYNMFGIKAIDSNPEKFGSEYAYEQKWFTPEAAIIGGAKFIAEKYVNNPNEKRDTLYKMKWNMSSPGTYQYATDIGWAYKQVKNIKTLIEQCKNPTLIFEVPVYKE